MPKKKKSKSSRGLKDTPRFSGKSLLFVGIIFGAVGAYLLTRIFAASTYVNYYGVLTASKKSATYSITTGTGNMDVSFSNNTADVLLTITNKSGKEVGRLKSIGKKDVKAKIAVTPDVYTFKLTTDQPFEAKKGYSVKITYPMRESTGPTAVITSPLNKETVAKIVDFSADATDDTNVTKVEFYVESKLITTDTAPPYTTKWDTTSVANGNVLLSVKSYDAANNVAESSGTIEVNNKTGNPSTRRFPGDPNPIVTGKAYWGSSIGGNGDPERHEGPTGKSLSVRRTFWQWDAATNTSSSMYKTVQNDLDNNRLPHISIKTPGWTAMGNGTYDAQIDTMLKKLDSYGKPVWLTVHHEPEGGGGSNKPDDSDGASAWRAMQKRIRTRMTAVKSKNVAFMPVLMSYTWNTQSKRNPEDWWVDGIWDAYIVDHYNDTENGDMLTGPWSTFVTWAEKKNMPFGLGEWGNRGTNAQAASEMQAFWDWSFANKKDMVEYAYFDSGLNSDTGSWEMTGEPLNKFRDIMKNDTRVQRINAL